MLAGLSIANNGQAAVVRSTPLEPGYLRDADAEIIRRGAHRRRHEEARRRQRRRARGPRARRDRGAVGHVHGRPESQGGGRFRELRAGQEVSDGAVDSLAGRGRCTTSRSTGPSRTLSANGYAVLYTNWRGSTGYGQEFVNGIQYSYPGKDYDDLMAGVDAGREGLHRQREPARPAAAAARVYHGRIVGHTNRFAAAVSMRPVINWHSFVGNTDGASWYRQFKIPVGRSDGVRGPARRSPTSRR